MNTYENQIRHAVSDCATSALPSAHDVLQGVRQRQDVHRRQRRTRYAVASTALGVALIGGLVGTLGRLHTPAPATVQPGRPGTTSSVTTAVTSTAPATAPVRAITAASCPDGSQTGPTSDPSDSVQCPSTTGPSPRLTPSTSSATP